MHSLLNVAFKASYKVVVEEIVSVFSFKKLAMDVSVI